MNRGKCLRCGLVNPAGKVTCRRCGASLAEEEADQQPPAGPDAGARQPRRSVARRLGWIFGTTLVVLVLAYLSLLLTSDDLQFDQRRTVDAAIAVLKQNGFERQVFALNHLTRYRGTDSWWNRCVGHQNAYAATNFPFEVVTLYPEFFNTAVDDTERAAILLHESYHLYGAGEDAALETTWREKSRIGWIAERYNQTKVWKNTKELTAALVPKLFSCGTDGRSDCVK